MLPEDLKGKAARRARDLGMSLGAFIRRSLETVLSGGAAASRDSLLADSAVYSEEAPDDLAQNHDRHLYGEKG